MHGLPIHSLTNQAIKIRFGIGFPAMPYKINSFSSQHTMTFTPYFPSSVMRCHCNSVGFCPGRLTSMYIVRPSLWAIRSGTPTKEVTISLFTYHPAARNFAMIAVCICCSVRGFIAYIYCYLQGYLTGFPSAFRCPFKTTQRFFAARRTFE